MKQLIYNILITSIFIALLACEDNNRHYPLLPEEPELSIAPNISSVYFKADGSVMGDAGISNRYTLTVVTNQSDWNVISDKTWCHAERDNNKLIISVQPNPTLLEAEEATVTLTAGEAPPLSISIIQSGIELHTSLQGRNYYLLWMDETTKAKIATKTVQDYTPSGELTNMAIWDDGMGGSFVTAPCEGANFYDEELPWISYKVGGNGYWSAAALYSTTGYDFSHLDASYTLHIGVKNATNASFVFRFNNGTADVGFSIGTETIEGFTPIADFTRNGEWQEIEIPMSTLIGRGISWNAAMPAGNLFVLLGGAKTDNPVEIDALFFYQK
jgi:hypothetical protein